MADQKLIEQLDDVIEATLRGAWEGEIHPELAMLAVVAAELRGLPDPHFKQELKRRILPMTASAEVRVPPGFHTVTPYLVVDGAHGLIDFLKSAFDATVRGAVPRPDKPEALMHAEVAIGDCVIELADATPDYPLRRFELHLYVPNADAVYERAIAAGARSLHPPTDQPYGDREAGVADPYGNYWYIATHGEEIRPEGLRTLTPFFHARDAAAFMDFLRDVFDARETSRFTSDEGKILHAVSFIGDSAVEVGDAHGQWQPMPAAMHVFVDDPDEVYARALRAGAQPIFAPNDQPYGQRMGGVLDQEGNRWFVARLL